MLSIRKFEITVLPMVTQTGLQRIDIRYEISRAAYVTLDVLRDGKAVVAQVPVALNGGRGKKAVLLPVQEASFEAVWRLSDREGNVLAETVAPWTKARERTIYVMLSAHTDVGLHESQYIQREMTVRLVDAAKKLCDETENRAENDKFRYVMEGTWFWNNYHQDRGVEAAQAVARDYLQTGKMGVCCNVAGNHIHTYGLEEMCRSAYEKKRLLENWGLHSDTMSMIDNNGMPASMIQPYADAGIRNLIFAPNHWNPLTSTVWQMDMGKEGLYLNPDVSGGGSRVDVRYESDLPMVFFWEGEAGSRILVWASTQYGYGGASFGLFPNRKMVPETIPNMEKRLSDHLPLMEEKYPYDVWLLACYDDNDDPNLDLTDTMMAWNAKWAWPRFRTLGDPGEPFRILRQKHGHQIPVLKGDITGGWYQHPLTTPELLARKFETDRLLPTAEKWSSVAAVLDENYEYPTTEFNRAWDQLILNDEHSYGVSGYQGRRVYETWIQHRDWVDKARTTAERENNAALRAITEKIAAAQDSVAVFNPTALDRCERVEWDDDKYALVEVPAFGYRLVDEKAFASAKAETRTVSQPPVIENRFYKITFAENGSMASIFDKDQGRELLELSNP